MPTYVYECATCQKVFEVEQRIVENALTTCLCGKSGTVKRVIQPTAIMFKGSGFYVNDSVAKAPSADSIESPVATAPVETTPASLEPAATVATPAETVSTPVTPEPK